MKEPDVDTAPLPGQTVEVNLADLNRKQRRKLASIMTKRHKAEKKKKSKK